MSSVLHADLPRFVAFGDAWTEFVQVGPDRWQSRNGGSAWKIACAYSALGGLGALGGAISQDVFGQALWRESQDANLDPRFIQQLPKPPLVSMRFGSPAPQQLLLGTDTADLHFRPEGLPGGWLRALRWAHFGGASLAREPLGARLLALAQGLKAEGKQISYAPRSLNLALDSSYDERLEQMCSMADLVQVSEAELRALFRVSDYHSGLAQIAAWNPSCWVMLDHGAAGSTLFQGDRECRALSPATEPMDGAGSSADSVLAALVDSLMQAPAAPLEQHLARGLAAGAAASAATGLKSPLPEVVSALQARVQFL